MSSTAGRSGKPAKEIKLATDAENALDMFASDTTAIDPRVMSMLKLTFYVPLTVCTSTALRGISDRSLVKMVKSHTSSGEAAHVLDVGRFPDEQRMGAEDWREAWLNLLELLPQICGAAEVARFRAQVEETLGSHFISSPLSVVPKSGGKLRLIQDCSREDGDGLSVNGRIEADLFPTRWGSASAMGEMVSTLPFSSSSVG